MIAPPSGDVDDVSLFGAAAVVAIYDRLLSADPSPVVALNRAVALAHRDGAESGLAEVDRLSGDDRLRTYHYLSAARADLLRRLGRHDEAAQAYRTALGLVGNEAEREFLQRRLAEIQALGG